MGIETDEAALIARSVEGDLDAFNQLIDHYQRAVYNLCLRTLGSAQAAEDATQEAFIASFRAVSRFRGGAFRSWLFRIAVNACYDEIRRRRSRPTQSLDAPSGEGKSSIEVPNPGPSLEERVESAELGQAIQDALGQLPADQRMAVILCDIQGMDYTEIAQVMHASLGTVKSRISRGRSRLREQLVRHRELLPDRFRQTSGER